MNNRIQDILSDLSKFKYENECLEAKSAAHGLPQSVWATYSAFANTLGGVILLGVAENEDKSLRVVGLDDPQKIIRDFWSAVNDRAKVSVNILHDRHVRVEEADGNNIVVIEIPAADRHYRPVFTGGDLLNGTFRRNSEGDYHCSREEINAMVRDQTDMPLDTATVPEMTPAVFNADTLKSYRNRFRVFKPDHIWNSLEDVEFLEKIGAVRIGEDDRLHPTKAGLLMFANEYDIVKEFPNYFLDFRETEPGAERWSDRVVSSSGDWSGNLFDFYFKIIARMTAGLKVPIALKDGLDRVDDTEAHKAMREALANALIHSDYCGRRGIVVEKSPGRVAIGNPGSMRISIEEAMSGGVSDPRNAVIFKVFSFLAIGERAGSGLYNIRTVWQKNGWKQPELTQKLSPDRVTLILEYETVEPNQSHNETNGETIEPVNETNKDVNDTVKPLDGQLDKTNDTKDARLIKVILENPHASYSEIANKLGVSRASVARRLATLRSKNIIKRKGTKRSGVWILIENAK